MIKVCEQHRDAVVVYTGSDCPLCDAEQEIKRADETIEELTAELARTKDELADLQEDD